VKKILVWFIVACMVLPFVPAEAQILSQPINVPAAQISSLSNMSGNIPKGSITDDYILGTGDQLEAHLIVGNNAMVLDYTFVINPEGKIFFPNIAEIQLSGLTLKKAKAVIRKEISRKYREKFTLSVMVSVPKKISIYITGQVGNPGLYEIFDGTRIADVLKSVGVAKGGSDLSEVIYLKRKNEKGELQDIKLSLYSIFLNNVDGQNIHLISGDIIAIPAIKSYVYVYGEVPRSGTFGYVPGQTISNYLNLAGGPKANASLGGVTVTRQVDGKTKVYHVDASHILHKGLSDKDIEIFPGDVINVPGNFFYFSDFASFANTILLALTLYSTVVK
jgi:polysaccharide biosynthesis/export protein